MNFNELLSFAKVYSVVMGYAPPQSVSKYEKEMCIELLKYIANNKEDWSPEQKNIYKLLADVVKYSI